MIQYSYIHNKLLHIFFSNNEISLSSTRASFIIAKIYALECLRKEQFLLLLGYGYMKNNLAHLGGYLTDQNVADMSDHFHFYFVFI